ncbi:hypothetical protein [Haliangium ochraceum]|uniref:Secreted protein n=1 Tax=Haliangium ochraceum (strain DSM 14365 / JCM 11303 / SMP-2) TaxID=502025 RepID=D0LI64_HALO1|nr:hypothetical protein [Haliangium ochraceum]ACY16443.1 hypothetical protein Hoch_3944 [Haliangium ochraceum DSM 14365]
MSRHTCLKTIISLGCLVSGGIAFADGHDHRPERGSIDIDLFVGSVQPGELSVQEPEMCSGSAESTVKWNQRSNKVKLKTKIDGLPYRPSYCFPEDLTTPYNEFPLCVDEGNWRIWFMGRLFTITSVFYYDAVSGVLIGNEYDVDPAEIESAVAVDFPVLQMVCTDSFEANPQTLKVNHSFEFDYDCITDDRGTGGVYYTYLPYVLDDPESIGPYYTNGGLPTSLCMSMDDIIEDFDAGVGGLALSTSYEPVPKQDYLASRDNPMIGWTGCFSTDPVFTCAQPLPPPEDPAECEPVFLPRL